MRRLMKSVKEVITSPFELLRKFNSAIGQGEVHLYACKLDPGSERINYLETLLSEQEKKNVSFFSFEKDQIAYTASQGFLRLVVAFYLDIDGSEVKFAKHRKGKPYLLNDTSLLYNISNSGDYVIIGISRHGEIGIDLEKIRPLDDFEDLVHKNFTPREREYIVKVPTETINRFFKLWTLKEAFLKAIGEGMRLTPDNLEFLIENGKFKLHTGPGFYEFDDWHFSDITIGNNYLGSLAHMKNPVYVSEIRYL